MLAHAVRIPCDTVICALFPLSPERNGNSDPKPLESKRETAMNDLPETPHPVDLLMDEHEVILQVLLAAERESFELQSGAALQSEFWLGVADFLAEYADRGHHAKEEEQLFPALIAQGMDAQQGPIAVMLHEHDQGRALLRDLRTGIADNDAGAVAKSAAAFAFLLRDHIQKENMILFEMARSMLPADVAREMSAKFVEAKHADRDWMTVARELCAHAGVEFEMKLRSFR